MWLTNYLKSIWKNRKIQEHVTNNKPILINSPMKKENKKYI